MHTAPDPASPGQHDPGETPDAGLPDADTLSKLVEFWRAELPQHGMAVSLRGLFTRTIPCPICHETGNYRPAGADQAVACYCQVQRAYEQKALQWQQHNFVPRRYQSLTLDDIHIEGYLSPDQRGHYREAVQAALQFAEEPQGNLVFTGAVGTGRSRLAAFIAGQLKPIPVIFISGRQLTDSVLRESDGTVRTLFYTVPVLIIDDLAAGQRELDRASMDLLYDLIYYRWGEMMPTVITSELVFGRLYEAHPPLFGRLRQDAQVFNFDWQPIPQLTRRLETERAAADRVNRCPHLGLALDPNTWVTYASLDSFCHRPVEAQPVQLTYQAGVCLSEHHLTCPVFQHEAAWPGPLPPDILREMDTPPASRRRRGLTLVLAILAVVAGIALASLAIFRDQIFGGRDNNGPEGGAITPRASQTAQNPQADASLQSSTETEPAPSDPTPTLTPLPDFTSTPAGPSPTSTPEPPRLALDFASNLRSGPGMGYDVIVRLEAGLSVYVLGRDALGTWLFVRTGDNIQGWLSRTQAPEGLNILALPFISETPTPFPTPAQPAPASSATSTPVPAVASAATATLSMLSSLTLTLYGTAAGVCGYADLVANYTIDIIGSSITLTRDVDRAVIRGYYTPGDGSFEASAYHPFGVEEMSGVIVFDGTRITVDGEQNVYYYDRPCDGRWLISGETPSGAGF